MTKETLEESIKRFARMYENVNLTISDKTGGVVFHTFPSEELLKLLEDTDEAPTPKN